MMVIHTTAGKRGLERGRCVVSPIPALLLIVMMVSRPLAVPSVAIFLVSPQVGSARDGEFMFGVDGTLTEALEKSGLKWYTSDGAESDALTILGRAGVTWFRIDITTNETGNMGLERSLELARSARNHAYKLDLAFYLSPVTADLGKQPAPADWQSSTLEDRAQAMRNYMRTTVNLFIQDGLSDHVFEIGNEIDYGITGVFGGTYLMQGDVQSAIDGLAGETWRSEALLLAGAIQGVREADPNARTILHIAHWWSPEFARAFFDFMSRNGVEFDVIGLSFYPSSGVISLGDTLQNPSGGNATRSEELLGVTVKELTLAMQKPIVIAEYAYPSSANIHGLFSWFNKGVKNYPLTPEGQARWVTDQTSWMYANQQILGAFYYQPEFYGPEVADLWQPFSFFDRSGLPKPALNSLENFALAHPELAEKLPSRRLILDAADAINSAQRASGTANVDSAMSTLKEAVRLYLDARYDEAASSATEAKRLSEAAAKQTQWPAQILFFAIPAAIIGLSVWIFRRARKRSK